MLHSKDDPRGEETFLGKCVKCGHRNTTSAVACARCTWPFSRDAWGASKLRIRRVTLDTGCVNAKGLNPDLNTLERWGAAQYLELQRSSAMLGELGGEARVAKARSLAPHPGLSTLGSGDLGGPDVLAGPDLPGELQQILFPTANPLTENQRYDVEHLRQHVRTGGDVFVTLNPNDFITRGRQATLRSFGIWVLSPSELVGLLTELYSWR
jgi:hypothetical protein